MADPTSSDVASAAQNNAGWVIALLASVWGWALRLILGRHLKALDDLRVSVDDMRASVGKIDGRLKFIEGRFKQQDNDHA